MVILEPNPDVVYIVGWKGGNSFIWFTINIIFLICLCERGLKRWTTIREEASFFSLTFHLSFGFWKICFCSYILLSESLSWLGSKSSDICVYLDECDIGLLISVIGRVCFSCEYIGWVCFSCEYISALWFVCNILFQWVLKVRIYFWFCHVLLLDRRKKIELIVRRIQLLFN